MKTLEDLTVAFHSKVTFREEGLRTHMLVKAPYKTLIAVTLSYHHKYFSFSLLCPCSQARFLLGTGKCTSCGQCWPVPVQLYTTENPYFGENLHTMTRPGLEAHIPALTAALAVHAMEERIYEALMLMKTFVYHEQNLYTRFALFPERPQPLSSPLPQLSWLA